MRSALAAAGALALCSAQNAALGRLHATLHALGAVLQPALRRLHRGATALLVLDAGDTEGDVALGADERGESAAGDAVGSTESVLAVWMCA